MTQKFVIAPDSFKGSLSSKEAAIAIESGIRDVIPDAQVVKVPMADGGEGTVEAVIEAVGGEYRRATVKSPVMLDIEAAWGLIEGGQTAVIEMAAASGLPLVPPEKQNPLKTTTYGTGQLVIEAINHGCTRIIIGMGGSATVDGGAGMAQALGYKLLDHAGNPIGSGGGSLKHISQITRPNGADLEAVEVIAASDVTNLLLGPEGAAPVFGPQKGATTEMVVQLESGLAHLATIIKRDLGIDVISVQGGGAAGGLGAGIFAFLNGKIVSGIDTIIELSRLQEKIKGATLVITGEGRIDYQTAFGKAPAGVAKIANEAGVQTLAVCGIEGEGSREITKLGVRDILSLMEIAKNEEEAKNNASVLLRTLIKNYIESFIRET
jgi:glycerate 2-kinase